MNIITFMGGSRATYESPATKVIEVKTSGLFMTSEVTKGAATINSLTNVDDYATDSWSD